MICQVKDNGSRFVRDFEGIDVGIRYWIYLHDKGLIFYFENNSENFILKESTVFALDYCYIEGVPSNYIEIVLTHGQNYLMNIVRS